MSDIELTDKELLAISIPVRELLKLEVEQCADLKMLEIKTREKLYLIFQKRMRESKPTRG